MVQLRLKGHTSVAYVAAKGWLTATLDSCPLHGHAGGCGFSRHGTYPRVRPTGTRIARYYCPEGRQTFSLLPDYFSSHLSGALDEVEETLVVVERSATVSAAIDALRPEVDLPGATRWVGRRRSRIRAALVALVTLFPAQLGAEATVLSLRARLGTEQVLMALRQIGERHLQQIPTPLGFAPPRHGVRSRGTGRQHDPGAVPADEVAHAPPRPDQPAEEEC